MPFESPNYTQLPNDLLGDWDTPSLMAEMSESELKVVLAICRLTFGYHRHRVKAAIPILMEMTGLARQSVISGATSAEKRGLIQRVSQAGRGKIATWEVLITEKVQNLDLFQNGLNSRPFEAEKVQTLDTKGLKFRHMEINNKETLDERKNHGAERADDDHHSRVSLTATPERRVLQAKFHASVLGGGKRPPQKFPTADVAARFDRAAKRLNGGLGAAIDAALGQGINSLVRIVNYVEKYEVKNARSESHELDERSKGIAAALRANNRDADR